MQSNPPQTDFGSTPNNGILNRCARSFGSYFSLDEAQFKFSLLLYGIINLTPCSSTKSRAIIPKRHISEILAHIRKSASDSCGTTYKAIKKFTVEVIGFVIKACMNMSNFLVSEYTYGKATTELAYCFSYPKWTA
ncbi:hypothetical protein PHYBLDRAFT_172342 [Phycomyces blakesleeanus NRRL 1555(-)]|uniref:Uncharacterized protein n=1 Tax=Phycomyces blakesleeanus (strain ATCC 8743b / DSM 1359 / FGSC 10004 / NBRC 33097 / NRRL 1555) TaxID=763407 RepID=A0A167L6M3_PHYB8|nr:hypothetical protein PHYBLDRAFT_172342 [Phycomyces blakesleeanus NRRL 1555(-)]OAD69709.1 hypothetical protein PHYBLDRAFT_172342 [Phycomyces blakesleeanus NRRL 1555(-)]|eukprot:XP_018287749.1 hypothetical protein PHYBLDRAFT_172342 [Phycomyces blakesleeanus NRRL 1555(-)]